MSNTVKHSDTERELVFQRPSNLWMPRSPVVHRVLQEKPFKRQWVPKAAEWVVSCFLRMSVPGAPPPLHTGLSEQPRHPWAPRAGLRSAGLHPVITLSSQNTATACTAAQSVPLTRGRFPPRELGTPQTACKLVYGQHSLPKGAIAFIRFLGGRVGWGGTGSHGSLRTHLSLHLCLH